MPHAAGAAEDLTPSERGLRRVYDLLKEQVKGRVAQCNHPSHHPTPSNPHTVEQITHSQPNPTTGGCPACRQASRLASQVGRGTPRGGGRGLGAGRLEPPGGGCQATCCCGCWCWGRGRDLAQAPHGHGWQRRQREAAQHGPGREQETPGLPSGGLFGRRRRGGGRGGRRGGRRRGRGLCEWRQQPQRRPSRPRRHHQHSPQAPVGGGRAAQAATTQDGGLCHSQKDRHRPLCHPPQGLLLPPAGGLLLHRHL